MILECGGGAGGGGGGVGGVGECWGVESAGSLSGKSVVHGELIIICKYKYREWS